MNTKTNTIENIINEINIEQMIDTQIENMINDFNFDEFIKNEINNNK